MLLAGQVKGLGPGGGAAACISRPLPVGVTVKHTNRTWRDSLMTDGRSVEQEKKRRETNKQKKGENNYRNQSDALIQAKP